MSTIRFKSKLFKIGSWTLLGLPKSASIKLPSRGMVYIAGTMNGPACRQAGCHFQSPLEPDGKGSHWFKVDEVMLKSARAKVGDIVKLEIEPTKDWPEPKVPDDLKIALDSNPQAHTTWLAITPIARWDWIRWISSTKNPKTRQHRIEVTFSKFKSGKRNPCCFNRSQCTVPDVSNNGVLLEPT